MLLETWRTPAEIPNGADPARPPMDDDRAPSPDNADNESERHPLGVRPSGNSFASEQNARDHMGVFRHLPDALLLVLLEFLDPDSLVHLGSTCRGFYAYCSHDQLWRDIAIDTINNDFEWRGSWRASLRRLPSAKLANVDCRFVFSDGLHRAFLCSQIPLSPYASNIPPQNEIPRLKDMSLAEFNDLWTDKPFILTSPVKKWDVFRTWSLKALLAKYGDVIFRCEAVDWTLDTYINYMNSTRDESPLYLFDRGFVEKMGLHVGSKDALVHNAYDPPEAFREDMFTLLGEARPDHRWLIIGPKRSGSTIHIDPNATSAWNALVKGSKYWMLFPRAKLPGVYVSEDQSEVTTPLSIAEWLLSFHAEARKMPGCLEGICQEGEVLHVPARWYHLVLNLEPAIAITQNFVPKPHIQAAISFLRDKTDQVSGFKDDIADPYALFMARLREAHPELAASFDDLDTKKKKRKWEEIVGGQEVDDGKGSGFSFGFGGGIDEEEIE